MADELRVIRVMLLVTAFLQLFLATVLWGTVQRRFLDPLYRRAASQGQPVPEFVRRRVFSRVTAAVMTAVPLILCWYLGTPDGAATIGELFGFRSRYVATAADTLGTALGAASPVISGDALRSKLASAIPYLTVLAFFAFAVYRMYLGWRSSRYRLGAIPPGANQLDPSFYHPQGAPYLRKLRRIVRLETWIWLGFIVLGNLLYFLVKP